VLDFFDVLCAADLLLHDLGAPHFAAAGRPGALNLNGSAATGLVHTAARAGIPFPSTRIADTLFNNRTGDVLCYGFPFAAIHVHVFGYGDWLANRVAVIPIAGLGHGLVRRARHVAVASLVTRLADRVDTVFVTSLVGRLADRVALVAVTGFVTRLANLAGDRAITGLVTRLADLAGDRAIASLVARLANRVALIAIASLVDVLVTGHRDLLTNCIVHGLAAGVRLLFPNNFFDCLVARLARLLGGTVVAAGSTSTRRTAIIAGRSAVACVSDPTACDHQEAREDGYPGCVLHLLCFLIVFNRRYSTGSQDCLGLARHLLPRQCSFPS
jgi:hypothetical protein